METALSFIPSLRDLTSSIRVDREIQADNFAVRTQRTNRYVLGSIKKMLVARAAYQPHFVPLFAAEDLLDARVSVLTRQRAPLNKQFSKMRFFISLCSLSLLLFLLMTPIHATEIKVGDKNGVMACAENSPSCIALCESHMPLDK